MSEPSFSRSACLGISAIILVVALQGSVVAQNATYRLHKDASTTTGQNQLKAAGPDAATAALNSANLKSLATGEYIIKAFDTQSGVPNASGVIPASSTVTFTLWLKKSANVGTMFPRAKLRLNSATGTSLCTATGSTALTTTLTKYTLTCTTAASVSMAATDRFYLWVGVNLTAGGSSNFQGTLNVEGTLNGNYDSYVAVPLPISTPSISGLSATSGTVGTSISVNGSNFGATQGSSTLKFNGVTATPASWSATSIAALVPSAATTGPVVVTVNGVASNGIAFTVNPKINSLSPASGPVGTSITISGTTFGAIQGSSTVSFNGATATPSSWNDTSIVIQVPPGTLTGPVVVTVGGQASGGVTFTVTPKINSLSPTAGGSGTSVTISGSSFGASQGSSTVTFNGTTAAPTSWSDTSIVAAVPAGATTGPVIVTVGGAPSDSLTFTVVTTGGISGKITAADGASPIPGATVKTLQGAGVVASTTTNSTGDYAFAAVDPGTYAVAASASGYGTKSKSLVIVSGGATTTANLSLDAIVSGAVSYVYDAVGRLISTVGPADTVVYSYDGVGNLLSISRQSSSQVSIIQLGPASGPIGSTVVISGTAFSANASQNTVAFNGVAAPITSATTTQIVVNVPAGATTGQVSVTSPNGSATSAIPFMVTSEQGAPTISSFAPTIGYIGTPVTISGDNFETAAANNKVKFNTTNAGASSATATSIATSVPVSGSGRIAVTTPAGSATSTGDFYVLPSGTSASDFELMGRMNFPGSQTVTITTVGKKALLLFDGVAGQRFSLDPSNNNIGISTLSIFKPDGTLWQSKGMYTWSQNFFEPQNFPVSGTYTMLLDTNTNYSGSMTLNLYNVPPDVTGPIAFGTPTPVTISTPGQAARLTFNGNAGQKVSLHAGGMTITSSTMAIIKPDGTTLTSVGVNINGEFMDNAALSVSGTYTVLLDPTQAYKGNATLTLYDSSDLLLPITPGGSPVTVSGTVPGQNAKLSFSGTAGQRISLKMSGITFNQYGGNVSIRNSAGTSLASVQLYSSTTNAFIDIQTLAATDTYYVLVDQGYMGTGSIVLTLYEVPPDLTGGITPGGPTVTTTIAVPGQNARLTFAGTAGQRVTLHATNGTLDLNYALPVTILNPDGTTLVHTYSDFYKTGGFLDTLTLPTTGTYTIFINPSLETSGSMDWTLYDSADVIGTIVPGGAPVTVTTTIPGQRARLNFSGTPGQKISLLVSNITTSSHSVFIYNPDGSTLASVGFSQTGTFIDTKTLQSSGTYGIVYDPPYIYTGSATFTLYDAPDVTGSVVIGGPPVIVTITTPGQDAVLTFEGTAGQQVTVRATNNDNLYNANVRLNRPDGSILTQGWTTSPTLILPTQTLPVTGTYTITINPMSTTTGQMTVNVTNP
ncbi:MAG TPA: IPT/TIG domain-containing protein [Pyrinomonadaceae bacterium]|nr:IPT/TIG domain-containing protein [Pyrinomonadaceae bacterium]